MRKREEWVHEKTRRMGISRQAIEFASPLASPLFCTLFNRGGNRRAFRLPGAGGGSSPP